MGSLAAHDCRMSRIPWDGPRPATKCSCWIRKASQSCLALWATYSFVAFPASRCFKNTSTIREATRAAFRNDGLFITGDRVRVGVDGELYFADRSKDMLKVGGENVAASEVERVILTVSGVREVAVVGRPDVMLGETVVAFIIPTAAAASDTKLKERAMEACSVSLASFKRPAEVRIVEGFPRATLEKVSKAELRRVLMSEQAQETI